MEQRQSLPPFALQLHNPSLFNPFPYSKEINLAIPTHPIQAREAVISPIRRRTLFQPFPSIRNILILQWLLLNVVGVWEAGE